MSVELDRQPITGEEFNRERLRLIEARVPNDAPEFRALIQRVRERDDYLFARYGKPLLDSHPGMWVAISLDGQVLIRSRSWQASADARATFGGGNYCVRQLAAFPGHELLSPRATDA